MKFLEGLFNNQEKSLLKRIDEQIQYCELPPELNIHYQKFNLKNLVDFTNRHIKNLIANHGVERVQITVDRDDNPRDPILMFITSLMEIGMIHEVFHQNFGSSNQSILSQRMEYLALAMNITIGNCLLEAGVKRIPKILNKIYIYYTADNIDELGNRIWPIVSQIDGADPIEINNYINGLINRNL